MNDRVSFLFENTRELQNKVGSPKKSPDNAHAILASIAVVENPVDGARRDPLATEVGFRPEVDTLTDGRLASARQRMHGMLRLQSRSVNFY